MTRTVAAVCEDPGVAPVLRDVLVPDPRGTQVRVRIDAVGICHTDLTMARLTPARRLPMIFGHEGTGIVEAVGPEVATLRPGQRVVLTFDSCGACPSCAADEPAYCASAARLNLHGAGLGVTLADETPVTTGFFGQSSFGRLVLASERNAIAIDHDIAPELAAPLGCSVQTGFGTVVNALAPTAGQAVMIFGAGAVGMSALLGARHVGAEVVVIDPLAARRELALELGAAAVVDPGGMADAEVVAAVRAVTGGGAHHGVDTTALPRVLGQAVESLRARGTLAVVGLGAPMAQLPVGTIMGSGLHIRGVVEGDSQPRTFIPHLAALVAAGALPLEKMIDVFDFDDFEQGWQAAASGASVKTVARIPV